MPPMGGSRGLGGGRRRGGGGGRRGRGRGGRRRRWRVALVLGRRQQLLLLLLLLLLGLFCLVMGSLAERCEKGKATLTRAPTIEVWRETRGEWASLSDARGIVLETTTTRPSACACHASNSGEQPQCCVRAEHRSPGGVFFGFWCVTTSRPSSSKARTQTHRRRLRASHLQGLIGLLKRLAGPLRHGGAKPRKREAELSDRVRARASCLLSDKVGQTGRLNVSVCS